MIKPKKIKVCFIATYAYGLFNPSKKITHGGSEIQLYLLAKELAKKDRFDISFMVGDFGQRDIEHHHNIRVYKCFKPDDHWLMALYKFVKILFKMNADIYIQRALNRSLLMLGLISKLLRRKLIYMIAHDGETDFTVFNKKDIVSIFCYRRGIALANIVIAQSEEEIVNLQKNYHLGKNKIFLLRKGLKVKPINDSDKIFDTIWIGRCELFKHPEIFVQFAKENPNKKCCMICPPAIQHPGFFTEIETKTAQLLNLKFLNMVSNEAVFQYLQKSKLFIFTSESEGELPMTVLEALTCGVPIVSVFLNPDNLITKKELGIFLEGNIDNLNATCKNLWSDTQKYSQYSQSCQKYIKKNRDIRAVAKQLSQVIDKAIYL